MTDFIIAIITKINKQVYTNKTLVKKLLCLDLGGENMQVTKNISIIVRVVGLVLALFSIYFIKENHSPFILTIGILGLITLIFGNFFLKVK